MTFQRVCRQIASVRTHPAKKTPPFAAGSPSVPESEDNRSVAVAQRKLQEWANESRQVIEAAELQDVANSGPQVERLGQMQKRVYASPSLILQRKQIEGMFGGMAQERANMTGLPDDLKAGAEFLSNLPLDDVKVHFNSREPARLQALAYTQGTDIHLGPQQVKHLPHEVWHVVQQKQGRVKPILRWSSVPVNDDPALEREADVMGRRALQVQRFELAGIDPSRQMATVKLVTTGSAENPAISSAATREAHSGPISTVQRAAVVQMVKTTTTIKSFATREDIDVTYDPAETLSQGAEGTVHVGTMNGRKVIVKVAKDAGLAGMRNEIDTFKNMRGGANIVGAIGYAEDGRIIVLQKAETSLNRLMPKSIQSRMRLVLGSGRGLQSMHEQNFTHGDLNLKNILVQGGEAKLTDFGATTDFRGGNTVQKPIPQELMWMIDEGLATEDDLLAQSVARKDVAMATDRKDFIKVAVNILLGDKENSALNNDKLDELQRQLAVKGLPTMSIAPIMRIARKDDPTAVELQGFLAAIELTIERMALQEELAQVPTPSSVSKRSRKNFYRQKRLAVQAALSANKKRLLGL